jgi:5-methylcytosine-specific restriction endonuclease McrA
MKQLNHRVLILNASFEILGTIDVARAIRLTMREHNPVLVEQVVEGRFLHDGQGRAYPVPSVVRLSKYANIRKRKAPAGAKRTRIYIRDNFTCQYCSKKMEAKHLTLDHVLPRSKAGTSSPENLVAACKPCNSRKDNRTPEQARMPLITAVKEYKIGIDKVLICHYAETRPEWKAYLEYDPEIKAELDRRDLAIAA